MCLLRECSPQDTQHHDERDRLRRRRHERGHRRRRAFIDIGRPHVERRGRCFEREARDQHRQPEHEERIVLPPRRCDPGEVEPSGFAVDERRSEEQDRGPEAADDQVLESRLKPTEQVAVDRAQDVERQREPLEAEKERQQVVRRHEERHAGTGGGKQRVVLGDMAVAHPLAERDADGQQARGRDDHLRELPEPVALQRIGDDPMRMRAADIQCDREPERGRVPERAHDGARRPPPPAERAAPRARRRGRPAGNENRSHQRECGREKERVHRAEREPVDVRALDHGVVTGPYLVQPVANVDVAAAPGCFVPNAWPLIAAGHAERTSRQARSGTVTPSSAGRRSSAASVTEAPISRCSTAEINRSMYIAASTIATAPTTDQPQPRRNTPARMRNSPANAPENGTARPMMPVAISTVARAGRPPALPPMRARSPVVARRSTMPASRKSVADTRPWFTICRTDPLRPRSLTANSPIVIRPICASDEYATTPRKSGARNASNDPYTSPVAASARMSARKSCVGPGNFAMPMRRNPYTAAFETTPDRTADTSAGASVYASRSQPWNGNSGALIANAAANPRKIQVLSLLPIVT